VCVCVCVCDMSDMSVSRIKLMIVIRSFQESKGNQCCVLTLWCLTSGYPSCSVMFRMLNVR
jgi:hypothetical protein